MGETGDSWGIPLRMSVISFIRPSSEIADFLRIRNECTHRMTFVGTPFLIEYREQRRVEDEIEGCRYIEREG